MNDDGTEGRAGGSLFNDDSNQHPTPRQSPRSPTPLAARSVYFWLNVGFVVVLLGLVFGAASETWFFLVAILWISVGIFVTVRARRNRPRQRGLFDDEPR